MREPGSQYLSQPNTLLWRVMRLLAQLSLLMTAFVMLGAVWWFFDLFANFRVQLLAGQLLLLAAFLILRRPVWAVAIGAACILNGIAVREYILPVGIDAGNAAAADIRVLNANIRSSNTNSAALIDLVLASSPDVFAVIELTHQFADDLSALHSEWPYRLLAPVETGNFGIGIYSRWPFADTQRIDLLGLTALDATIAGETGSWRFLAVHTVPPMSASTAQLRDRQIEQLAQYTSALAEEHIVVGDLNITPFSAHFPDFLETSGLRDALRGRGPAWTWPSFFPLLGIPIDYVLTSSGFDTVTYVRGTDIGSDHYPVIVDISSNTDRQNQNQ